MTISPLAGKPTSKEMLIDPARVPGTRIPWNFRAAWLRLKQIDLIPGKGQFR
jgi:hypothetical protein